MANPIMNQQAKTIADELVSDAVMGTFLKQMMEQAAKQFALAIIFRNLEALARFGINTEGLDSKQYEYQDKFAEEVIYRMAYLGEPDF